MGDEITSIISRRQNVGGEKDVKHAITPRAEEVGHDTHTCIRCSRMTLYAHYVAKCSEECNLLVATIFAHVNYGQI